jgi:hypothetical protein
MLASGDMPGQVVERFQRPFGVAQPARRVIRSVEAEFCAQDRNGGSKQSGTAGADHGGIGAAPTRLIRTNNATG